MHIWLGDSWPAGCELAMFFGEEKLDRTIYPVAPEKVCRPDLAFPAIVSSAFKQPHINLAFPGGSIHYMLHLLTLEYKKGIHPEGTTVFVCSTGEMRRFGVDVLGREYHTGGHLDVNKMFSETDFYYYNRNMYSLYDYTMALNHIYNLVLVAGWELCVVNVWRNASLESKILDVPSGCFLGNGKVIYDLSTENVTKFMRPCITHPNLIGHELIASRIVQLLGSF